MRPGTAIAALALLAGSAHAGITVFGNGLAHDCYVAASHDYGARAGEETCTVALDNEPLSPRDRAATYINRGVIRAGQRRLAAALADYEEAIAAGDRLKPAELGVAYVDRASILTAMGRFPEALESVNKGIALGTLKPEIAYYVRAVAEESQGDLKAAYFDYKQAVKLEPGFALAARQLERFHVEIRPANGT